MNPAAQAWLIPLIREAGGWMTFERFMAEALYHTEHGYYAATIETVGREGDFSTSATLSPTFAEAIARWAVVRIRNYFSTGGVAVIEVGAGSGDLAHHFLNTYRALGGPPVDYYAVECSPRLRAALGSRTAGEGVTVFASVTDALAQANGRALIISNELVDAFPARQLIWQQGDWREIVLEIRAGRLAEAAIPFTDLVDAEAPGNPRDGERIFIHPAYQHWLKELVEGWTAGTMLTIDYGAKRPGSEARAYRGHDRKEAASVYDAPGQQDLTCDVNFRDLKRWGEELGLTTVDLCPQFDFLERWLPNCETRAQEDETLQFLRNPIGAGGAFQVLEQRRDTPGQVATS